MDAVPDPLGRIPRANRPLWGWGIAISLVLHVLVAVALMFDTDRPEFTADAAPIPVELVPPPEIETPELETPEPAPEEEEAPPEEETAPAEESPAPPEPAEEEAVAVEEPPAVTEEEAAEASPQLPVLQPVVEFGETDGGSETSEDGNAAEELPDVPEDQSDPEPEEALSGQEADEPAQAELEEPVPQEPGPEDLEPEVDEESEMQAAEPKILAGDIGVVGPIVTAAAPTPKPEPELESGRNPATGSGDGVAQPGAMTAAKRLFSDEILDDPRVRTAMAGMPPEERLDLLCMTELRAQLNAANPPRRPEMLPSFRSQGTVLERRQAAFRSQGQWYALAFRCDADDAVTKVQKFSYRVGDPIPRAQWQQRGFPSY